MKIVKKKNIRYIIKIKFVSLTRYKNVKKKIESFTVLESAFI
jgi:hypothetical protein